nr:hypothetical protein [Tanacetum cinerariifolium]
MRTRSQSHNNFPQQEASPSIVKPLRIELLFLKDQFQEDPPEDPPEIPMVDNRTIAELLQAPTEGYEDAIVIPEIAANNFELKHGLISLVQNKQFFRHDKEDPHAHIRYFNKITSTMKVPNFFPPSKTINLHNEITRFQQRFDESFYEAWHRFNDLLRACPHHGFSELHQLDTFYNALNVNDHDSLNSSAGGNFLDKMPRECLKIIESKSKVRQSRAKAVIAKVSTSSSTPAVSSEVFELKDMVRALLLEKKNQSSAPAQSLTPAPVKAVEPNCVLAVVLTRMDKCSALADLGASINLMPLCVWEGLSLSELTPTYMTLELADRSVSKPIGIAKDVSVKVGVFHFPADFVVVDFEPDPRGKLTLCIENEAITYNLDQTSRYSANYNQMTANKIDVICEEYSQEVLGFSDTTTSGNLTPYDDPIVSTTSHTLTLFEDSDFLLLEEADTFLTILNSESLPPFPNHEQYMPLFKKELKVCEAKTVKSSIDEPPEVELKDLPPHLEYAFLEGDNKVSTRNFVPTKFSWKRRVNPKIHDVIKKEVEKLLDVVLIYPISDSPWVSPVHCVPKKSGFTIVENEENELIPTRLVTGWRKMLQRCKDTNLSLKWEKSHFMVKEGIVLGYKISKNGIEVNKAKVDVIAKLPHPTTVKETKLDEVIPFEKQTDDLKKRLAKNNEAKMVINNALPRKEYERIFMCNTAKEIWKSLLITHQGYSSKNYVRKFLIALHPKWRAKVMAIEESKDLTSLSTNEHIRNLKVHEMIIKKDSKIVKAKVERKSIALKAKKESSDKECSTTGSEDEECGDPNHLIGECLKPSKDKNQRAFVRRFWSDSGEEYDEKVKDETYLVARASSEKNKGVDLECAKCHAFKTENEKLKEESTRLNKFEKSTRCLNEMLRNQKPSGNKSGLGFKSFEASSSGIKEIKFVKAQKKASSD